VEGAVHVKGLTELQRAFKHADRNVRLGFRSALRAAAEPVRVRAETLAVQNISNLHAGDPWARMRVGITTKVVYVAPKPRGTTFGPQKRRAFGPMLLEEALEPALEQTRPALYAGLEQAIDRLIEKDF
jgi:hypothetical protein